MTGSDLTRITGPGRSASIRARGGWLAAIFLSVLLLTWIKTLAVWYPVVFGDESTYSLLSKYGSDEQVIQRIGLIDHVPNHLYFSTYQLAYSFGDNFLTGAKLLNSVFIAAAFVPIYLLCRIFLSYGQSVALAAISVLGPISSYATYFIPESMYFFGFWIYVYLSIRHLDKPVIAQGVLGGALLGLQVLIKPHALILLPCSAILYAVVVWKKINPQACAFRLVAAWAALLLSFSAVRIAMVYLLTGKLELSFTGPMYATVVADSSRLADTLARLPDYLTQLRGHASFLLLSYFTPLVILAVFAGKRLVPTRDRRASDQQLAALFVFAVTIFALTIAMTVKFSADIIAADSTQTLTRLHGRYYSFALPLLPICAAIILDRYHSDLALKQPLVSGVILAAMLGMLAYVVSATLGSFEASFGVVDFPDAFFLQQSWARLWALLAAVLVTVLLLNQPRFPTACFLIYWGVLMSVATIAAQHWAVTAIQASNEDRFPLVVKNLLGPDERNSGLIVASTYADGKVFRVMFHLNSLSHVIIAPKAAALGEARIDADRDWLLLLDSYRILVPSQTIIKGDGFELIRLIKAK